MDPLSIIASAITLVQALQGTLNLLSALRGAPAEIRALTEDISDLEAVLRTIDQASRGQDVLQLQAQDGYATVQRLLTKARHKVVELQQILTRRIVPGCSKAASKFARLQWLHEKSRVTSLQQDLQAIKLDIVAVWGAIASWVAPFPSPL